MTGRTSTEVLTEFIEGGTEASGTGEGPEAAHGIVTLFDRAMVLFHPIIQVAVGAVLDPSAQAATNGAGIGIMTIGGDALRLVTNRLNRLLEKRGRGG